MLSCLGLTVTSCHAQGKHGEEGDAQREFNRQREYLEKSVESLKRKLAKDMEMHRTDNARFMRENVALTKEINELRREIILFKRQRKRRVANALNGGGAGIGDGRHVPRRPEGESKRGGGRMTSDSDPAREAHMQQVQIDKHRARVHELEVQLGLA